MRDDRRPTEPGIYAWRRKGRSGIRAVYIVELRPRRCDGRLSVWDSRPSAGGPPYAASVDQLRGEWSTRLGP